MSYCGQRRNKNERLPGCMETKSQKEKQVMCREAHTWGNKFKSWQRRKGINQCGVVESDQGQGHTSLLASAEGSSTEVKVMRRTPSTVGRLSEQKKQGNREKTESQGVWKRKRAGDKVGGRQRPRLAPLTPFSVQRGALQLSCTTQF